LEICFDTCELNVETWRSGVKDFCFLPNSFV
jgi:hypothetical protein